MSLLASLSTLVITLAELAVVVVSVTAVRKARPDDWAFLAAGAGMHVFATLSFPFFMTIAGSIAVLGSITTVYTAVQWLMVLLRSAGWLMLAAGIYRITAPAPGSKL